LLNQMPLKLRNAVALNATRTHENRRDARPLTDVSGCSTTTDNPITGAAMWPQMLIGCSSSGRKARREFSLIFNGTLYL